jgi:hypothetical protein
MRKTYMPIAWGIICKLNLGPTNVSTSSCKLARFPSVKPPPPFQHPIVPFQFFKYYTRSKSTFTVMPRPLWSTQEQLQFIGRFFLNAKVRRTCSGSGIVSIPLGSKMEHRYTFGSGGDGCKRKLAGKGHT